MGSGRGKGGLPDARLSRGNCGNAWIKVMLPETLLRVPKTFFEVSRIIFDNFSRYGYTPTTIWMDNLYCYGTEDRLDVSTITSGIHSTWLRGVQLDFPLL